ncbi:protein translocase subunit SecD [Patescibacteria group bacterium]|nr:protein translocase subunit SecD [Patescibacteria group bacterium]
MKNPRNLFWLIIGLTFLAIFINLPDLDFNKIGPFKTDVKIGPGYLLKRLNINKELTFKKGLDLAGGTSIVYKADMSDISSSQKSAALESSKSTIERRINFFGVSEPVVHTSTVGEESRVIVELPGVNIEEAKNIIGTTAKLSFWEQGSTESANTQEATASAYPLGMVQILGINPIKTDLSGNDLESTSVSFDQNTGKPQVQLVFTSDGSKKFASITKRNVNKIVAIALDNQVVEDPRVNEPILTGNAVISGSFTIDQAKALSVQLNAGALPVPLSTLSEYEIEATLGMSSLEKSLFAGFLGILTIIIFMSVLYGKKGIIASFALLIYTLLVLSIFKISSITPYAITLTLSGIAGFILSIGMAVDANILIFERMKEEERQGRSKGAAMEIGFSRAWTSIRDSNIATLITSIVLYKFGTGMVRGFALVLAIGVLVSMFSAIIVTRTFLRKAYR